MIYPNYKERVIAALSKSEGARRMRQLLEHDYDIRRIMRCDENECIKWRECGGIRLNLSSPIGEVKEDE